MNDGKLKPGIWTTEFWITFASLIISGFVAVGMMDNARAEQWQQIAALLIAAIAPSVFTMCRTYLKSQ